MTPNSACNVAGFTQTERLQELPTKVEKEKIKDYAQLDHRFALAQATHGISIFTQGIMAMERTLLGVIEVNPRELLEEGIRKQLVRWGLNPKP